MRGIIGLWGSRKGQSTQRWIALAICAVIVASSMLLTAFIFTHANHRHDHCGPDGGCAACAHMTTAENLLRSISAALAVVALAFGCLRAILAISKPADSRAGTITPVRLKVRLNN